MLIDLNGSEDGRKMLEQNDRVYKAMSYIIEQNKFFVVISKALKFYVNASTFQNFDFMMKVLPNPEFLVACVVDSDNHFADLISFILSNLSRSEAAADYLSVLFKPSIEKLVEAYCNENYNKKSRVLHYLGLMLANLAVTRKGRVLLREKNHFVRLVSFINHPKSLTRRRAAVQLARNFCLDVDQHSFLLSYDEDTGLEKINSNTEEYDTESDLLIKLLKPLCDGSDQSGDTENGDLDDEDIGKLPLDLQYLDEDVKREQDPDSTSNCRISGSCSLFTSSSKYWRSRGSFPMSSSSKSPFSVSPDWSEPSHKGFNNLIKRSDSVSYSSVLELIFSKPVSSS